MNIVAGCVLPRKISASSRAVLFQGLCCGRCSPSWRLPRLAQTRTTAFGTASQTATACVSRFFGACTVPAHVGSLSVRYTPPQNSPTIKLQYKPTFPILSPIRRDFDTNHRFLSPPLSRSKGVGWNPGEPAHTLRRKFISLNRERWFEFELSSILLNKPEHLPGYLGFRTTTSRELNAAGF